MTKYMIRTVKIESIFEECESVKTLLFNMKDIDQENYLAPKPGQFVMIWVPGIDEVPMSISKCDKNGKWSITVKNVGECTEALINLNRGDLIGVRGPLGNYFEIPEEKNKKLLLIGGGIGTGPLNFLATELDKKKIPFELIEAIRSDKYRIFERDFKSFKGATSRTTMCIESDDSSREKVSGVSNKIDELHGLGHEGLEQRIKKYKEEGYSEFNVYTCGPEKMMYEVFKVCEKHNIQLQASFERIMRCGCGLCGLCALDPLGLLVCQDGPVFKSEVLRKMDDFGRFKRDFTGKKIPIN